MTDFMTVKQIRSSLLPEVVTSTSERIHNDEQVHRRKQQQDTELSERQKGAVQPQAIEPASLACQAPSAVSAQKIRADWDAEWASANIYARCFGAQWRYTDTGQPYGLDYSGTVAKGNT